MNRLGRAAIAALLVFASAAGAEDINYDSMTEAGFGDVAELFKSMTPEQQALILQSAAVKQEDLKKLSPQELQQLRDQLRKDGNTVYMDKIDPAKLDPSKSLNTEDTMKQLDSYQTKYEQGEIDNSAVKPLGSAQ